MSGGDSEGSSAFITSATNNPVSLVAETLFFIPGFCASVGMGGANEAGGWIEGFAGVF